MNKEAIERTKARCKKPKYDHVWEGSWSAKEHQEITQRFNEARERNKALQNAKLGEFIQVPNEWVPESGREVLIAFTLTSIMWALFAWLVLL